MDRRGAEAPSWGSTFIGLVLIVDSLLSLLRRLSRPTSQRLLHRPGFHSRSIQNQTTKTLWVSIYFFSLSVSVVSLGNDRPHKGAKLSLACLLLWLLLIMGGEGGLGGWGWFWVRVVQVPAR